MRNSIGLRKVIGIAITTIAVAYHAAAQEHFYLNSACRYSGRATGLNITQVQAGGASNTLAVADSGGTPITGGQVQNFLADSGFIPNVTAEDLNTVTMGSDGTTHSQSWMAHLDARLGTHHLTAIWVESTAVAREGATNVPSLGKSSVEGLTIDGVAVAASGETNQTITLSDGWLVINEQISVSAAHFGSMTVNALHLYVTGSGNLVAASSKAEIIKPSMLGFRD